MKSCWTTGKMEVKSLLKNMPKKFLLQIADNYKLNNTEIKRDVIDAMFRQITDASTKPFRNHHELREEYLLQNMIWEEWGLRIWIRILLISG